MSNNPKRGLGAASGIDALELATGAVTVRPPHDPFAPKAASPSAGGPDSTRTPDVKLPAGAETHAEASSHGDAQTISLNRSSETQASVAAGEAITGEPASGARPPLSEEEEDAAARRQAAAPRASGASNVGGEVTTAAPPRETPPQPAAEEGRAWALRVSDAGTESSAPKRVGRPPTNKKLLTGNVSVPLYQFIDNAYRSTIDANGDPAFKDRGDLLEAILGLFQRHPEVFKALDPRLALIKTAPRP
jgi:hypothetical protein